MDWHVMDANPALKEEADKLRVFVEETRRRKMPYGAIINGLGGNGPYLCLADGSVKFDFVRGMGTYLFGYRAPHLEEVRLSCSGSPLFFENHFSPSSRYYVDFLKAVAKESPSHLVHAFPCSGGAIANDFALKMAFGRKRRRAKNIFAFTGAFHGRTIGTSYMTDIPRDRQGFPVWSEVLRIPFYDPLRPEESIKHAQAVFKKKLKRDCSGSVSCFLLELFQGEGGFHAAPREFFLPLFEIAKNEAIPLIFDEVQTGLRTGDFLYSRRLGLEDFADIITLGKALYASAVLFTKEFSAERGIAQTMPMTTLQAALGAHTIEHLRRYGYWQDVGIIRINERVFASDLALLKEELKPLVKETGALGNLFFIELCNGSLEAVKDFCLRLFDKGVMGYWCGRGPYRARFYFPVDITIQEWQCALSIIKDVIRKIA